MKKVTLKCAFPEKKNSLRTKSQSTRKIADPAEKREKNKDSVLLSDEFFDSLYIMQQKNKSTISLYIM